jgi:hypothetical protein
MRVSPVATDKQSAYCVAHWRYHNRYRQTFPQQLVGVDIKPLRDIIDERRRGAQPQFLGKFKCVYFKSGSFSIFGFIANAWCKMVSSVSRNLFPKLQCCNRCKCKGVFKPYFVVMVIAFPD